MENFTIQSKTFVEGSALAAGGRDDGASLTDSLPVSFGEFLSKAGQRLGQGLNAFSERADLTRALERPEPIAYHDDPAPTRPAEHAERADTGARDHATRENRPEAPLAERRDDGRDRATDSRDRQADSRRDDRAQSSERPADRAPAREETMGDTNVNADDPSNKGEAKAEDDGTKKGEADHERESGKNGKAHRHGDGAADGVAAQHAALAKQTAEAVLAGLLDGLHVKGQSGQAAKAANEPEAAQHRADPAVSGLANALAALARQAGTSTAKPNGAHSNNPSNTSNTNENSGEIVTSDTDDGADDVKARQAAQLAEKIGNGQRLAVRVTVNQESQVLVSKPSFNLTPTAVTAEGNSAANGATAGSGANAGNNPATANAGQALAATVAAQAQVQAGGSSSNANAASQQAVGESKAISATTGANAATPASVHAGGAEASTQPSAAAPGAAQQPSQPQQAHNNTPAQAPRFAQIKAQVLDQVSVQVTKALNSGTDKITIDLKPAHLGRIEVTMEVASDGRMMAVITADNKDTLDLLQRDARDLARALQDAGLQADAGNLNFNLREQQGDRRQAAGEDVRPTVVAEDPAHVEAYEAPATLLYGGGIRADGRVDIRA